jgi:hypothetical protein
MFQLILNTIGTVSLVVIAASFASGAVMQRSLTKALFDDVLNPEQEDSNV